MCDATAIGTAGLGMQTAGAASSAVGAYYGAKAQRSSLEFQATMDEINATAAERTAQSALLAGQRQAQALQMRTAQVKGAQTTALASNGIDLGSAGAARLLTSTDVMGEIDVDTTLANSIAAAWGYRSQGTNSRNAAEMKRAGAETISPWMAGASSLLGSGGSIASSWYRLNKKS